MESQTERRVRYFLTSNYRGREDVRGTLRKLEGLGHLVLIGGMLRDIALFGNAGFRSDVDLVIDTSDTEHFDQRMESIGARVNRFGGYALPANKWQIDVWPLAKTWAHTAGHIKVSGFDDLLDSTFFRCDAIIYDLSAKRLHTKPGYFDDLENKILEINLLPNPNPIGNAVRAFRYSMLKGFRWGPQLTQFMADSIRNVGWTTLAESEKRSFRTSYIARLDRDELENSLSRSPMQREIKTFDPRLYQKVSQLELPFAV